MHVFKFYSVHQKQIPIGITSPGTINLKQVSRLLTLSLCLF